MTWPGHDRGAHPSEPRAHPATHWRQAVFDERVHERSLRARSAGPAPNITLATSDAIIARAPTCQSATCPLFAGNSTAEIAAAGGASRSTAATRLGLRSRRSRGSPRAVAARAGRAALRAQRESRPRAGARRARELHAGHVCVAAASSSITAATTCRVPAGRRRSSLRGTASPSRAAGLACRTSPCRPSRDRARRSRAPLLRPMPARPSRPA